MVGGIVFQLVSIIVFALFFVRVMWSARAQVGKAKEVKLIVAATGISVLLIFIRSIYRTIELSQGWSGFLITHEGYFIALDGTLMILAIAVFNIFNPGLLLSMPLSGQVVDQAQRGVETEKEKRANLNSHLEPMTLQEVTPK